MIDTYLENYLNELEEKLNHLPTTKKAGIIIEIQNHVLEAQKNFRN